jgi:hypothetical protein
VRPGFSNLFADAEPQPALKYVPRLIVVMMYMQGCDPLISGVA